MTALAITTTVTSSRHRLANVRRRWLVTAKLRALFILAGFVLVAACAILRIFFLGVFENGASHYNLANALIPDRGEIVDRNGEVLARDFAAYTLWYKPDEMGDGPPLIHSRAKVAAELVKIFPDLDYDEVYAKLGSKKGVSLRGRILPEEANRVHELGEPAIQVPREPDRIYPQGSMAAHVLGFVDSYKKGQVGMEAYFDKKLTDRQGRLTPAVLSIDVRVQGALEDELERGMALSHAKGAAGIVLNVDTGEVLALASLPSFNPNNVLSSDKWVPEDKAKLGETANVFNRATNQVYELGSCFKPITIAAAIDAGVVTDLGRRWPATPLHIDGFTIHDDENLGPSLNVPETLIHSSNIVSAQIGDELGGDRLKKTLESLGFNERPYIELPARGFPIWPRGEWPRLRTMTISFGHGIAVTPLHLATAYAALVNGGVWRPATLRKLTPAEVPKGRRVFTASTSARIRQLLRMIVMYGTGRKADAPGFRIGGKTGSAEKPGLHGYRKHALITTFAAAFPMDKPRYVVIAMMDEPQGTEATSFQRTSAWNAVPVVGRLIPRIGPLLGVMPDETRDIDISDLIHLIPREVAAR